MQGGEAGGGVGCKGGRRDEEEGPPCLLPPHPLLPVPCALNAVLNLPALVSSLTPRLKVVVMEAGRVKECGSYADLMASGLDLAALMHRYEQAEQGEEGEGAAPAAEAVAADGDESKGGGEGAPSLQRSTSEGGRAGRQRQPSDGGGGGKSVADGRQLVEEEERQQGTVGWPLFKYYFAPAGAWMGVFVFFTTTQSFWQV